MVTLVNRCKVATATTGTGTITLGSAESGYQTFADAGVANADVVRYVIEDGNNFEIGTGTYTSSGTTLSRTVSESSNSNNAINLSGSATVFIGATAEDILSDVVDDTTPQLGGNLDVQAREITTSTSNGNIKLTPNGTGVVEVKGVGGNDGTLQLNCSANSHGVKIKSPPHSASASYTLTLPDDDGAASEFLQTDGSGNLSWAAGGSIGGNTGVDFNDNVKARFGTGNDFEIYHDGTTNKSHITESGASHLIIQGQEIQFDNAAGASLLNMSASQIEMFHSGNKKLETTSSGIQTTGTVNVNNAYTLPTSDGTNGQVLTTNGSGAVTFADAAGGADLYADNYDGSSTKPNASGSNSVALGKSAVSGGGSSIAFGALSSSAGNLSSALGFNAAVGSSGAYAAAIGQAYANGQNSFAAAIATNSSSYGASGSNSIAGGDYNKATATDSLCWGGDSNVAQSGAKSAVVGGWQNNCSGAYSFISGGRGNKITSGSYSRAGGLQADVNGTGIDTWSSGRFSSDGDAQTSKRVLIANTTDATPTVAGTQNINSLAANQVTLPNNSAYFFSGTCIARQQAADGTDVGAWEFKGAIRREANAGTTTLIKSTIDEFNVPTGWDIALSADTTNGCLKVQVTGAASTDIRWVATVQTSEVTYA